MYQKLDRVGSSRGRPRSSGIVFFFREINLMKKCMIFNQCFCFDFSRHNPANYLVDANAASKAMRNPAHAGGVPVTLTGGLTLGRSSSPAGTSRANPANYPPGGLAQRVLTNPADHAGQVRYVPFGPGASNPPFGTAGIRDVRDVYNMRGNVRKIFTLYPTSIVLFYFY